MTKSNAGSKATGTPQIGDVIGDRYRLDELIASGGMGVIMRARQLALDRDVAIKLLHPYAISSEVHIKRFRSEVKLAKSLSHAHTVQIHDYGETDLGALFLVMEYLEGDDLAKVIENEAPIPVGRATDIALQMLDGLGEAHASGIVHRDLKPSNVFICKSRRDEDLVKILDFGIAKSLHTETDDLTATGHIAGTAKYLAPELMLIDQVSPAADVYAAGLILYEMLTGQAPFHGNTLIQSLVSHLRQQMVLPDPLRGTELGDVLTRATAKHPGYRFANADDMYDALQSAAASVSPELRLEPTNVHRKPTNVSTSELEAVRRGSINGLDLLVELTEEGATFLDDVQAGDLPEISPDAIEPTRADRPDIPTKDTPDRRPDDAFPAESSRPSSHPGLRVPQNVDDDQSWRLLLGLFVVVALVGSGVWLGFEPFTDDSERTTSDPSNLRAVQVGDTVQLHAAFESSAGTSNGADNVMWTSETPDVAEVDEQGEVVGVSPGRTTISVSARDDESLRVEVPIQVEPRLESLEITTEPPVLNVGETVKLHTESKGSDGQTLTDRNQQWKSGDEEVARVDPENGELTAVGPGTAIIGVADVLSSQTDTVKITVE